MGRSLIAAALPGCALLACGDLFHATDWDPPRCAPGEACDTSGGAGAGAAGSGAEGGGSPSTGGAGGGGNGGPTSGPGGGTGGSCPSDTEDCLTSADDDCGGDTNSGCGLMLFLAFDEGSGGAAEDTSGNGHDGSHACAYIAGVRGTALAFDGTQGVIIDSDPGLVWGFEGAPYTIAYWLRIDSDPNTFWRGLLHKGNTDCGTGDRTGAMFLNPSTQTIHATVSTSTPVDPMTMCHQYVNNSTELLVGVWFHVASVVDGAEMRLYINGDLNASVPVDNTISSQGPVYVGHDPSYSGLIGAMDELQVYDRALTQAEIDVVAAIP